MFKRVANGCVAAQLPAMCAKVVIAGGTGFIGSALVAELVRQQHEPVILTRDRAGKTANGVRFIRWLSNSTTWHRELESAHAILNLAGSTIDCRHTPENLARVLGSRVESIRAIADGIARCDNVPRVWVQGTAVGIYGNRGLETCDENARPGVGALAELCVRWEQEFHSAVPSQIRGVVVRTGLVLGKSGGAYPRLASITQAFLGGHAGSGQQFMSWISLEDLVRIFLRAIFDDTMRGTYNGMAPNPVTNAEFMRELRRSVGRPWSPPVPAFAVKLGARLMDTDPSLVLEGQRAIPSRLLAEGFSFRFATLPGLLHALNEKSVSNRGIRG